MPPRKKEWKPTDGAEPGTLSLDRWAGERLYWHRGLLLYAMQHASGEVVSVGRSRAAVSRALGVSEVSMWKWAQKQKWDERISAVVDAEGLAVALYRTLYMDQYGKTELPHVLPNVVVPITIKAMANTEQPVASEADKVIEKARLLATSAVRAEEAIMQQIQSRRKDEKRKVEQYKGLLDAAIAESARLLKERRLKLTAKDIPVLIAARQELSQWLMQQDDKYTENMGGVESARMKHARDTGKDLVEAMWQDLEEIRTILSALRSKRDAEKDTVLTPTNFSALTPKEAPPTASTETDD